MQRNIISLLYRRTNRFQYYNYIIKDVLEGSGNKLSIVVISGNYYKIKCIGIQFQSIKLFSVFVKHSKINLLLKFNLNINHCNSVVYLVGNSYYLKTI